MRKLMMKMSVSLDGFVAETNGNLKWMFKSTDEASTAWVAGLCGTAGLHIMGTKTFQSMGPYWPTSTGPFTAPMNEAPKAVFTRKGFTPGSIFPHAELSPAETSWAQARVFDGDLATGITELKSEPGKPILAHGGAEFMRSLIATGLMDEYHIVTHPIILGAGMPIFNGLLTPLDLKLVDVKVFSGGVVAHTYHPA
ncbi:MAG TPA: dihydrofolate reductase family protein [Chitinophaga sp.]|uniref:dihydrofolate reductase family protein n=1 Tax=Chitinophaga sp. TaxID=1869181 RepID=UPI002C937248|nr:dihydrofolate reductase family protein [Chitinophaga sp.]HVI44608.1 dihydrofolate reductase family protein [Chitinophaga sp.]